MGASAAPAPIKIVHVVLRARLLERHAEILLHFRDLLQRVRFLEALHVFGRAGYMVSPRAAHGGQRRTLRNPCELLVLVEVQERLARRERRRARVRVALPAERQVCQVQPCPTPLVQGCT